MAENSLESIAHCLEQSLLPQFARAAEQNLKSIESQPGFSINLLHVIASTNLSISIRLAGALFFKNLIRRKWIDEDGNYHLPIDDINKIKSEILDVMIKLPNNLQVQIGESISLIAESDFPHNWPNLIDTIVGKLSMTDFVNNKALLLVSHSIFKRWRALFRSDELFLEIKMVLEKFVDAYLKLFVEIDKLIDKNLDNQASLTIYLENLLLMMQIYYDFNCQDIPEFFEDNMNQFMTIIHKYLMFNSNLIRNDDEDEEVDVLIKLKTSIVELISLYTTRYADVFGPLVQNFITSVWELINNFATKQPKYDLFVVKALHFLTSVSKITDYQSMFNNESAINEIIKNIILPNIAFREADEELFEDEPINFVRSDLEGSDFDTRRKSATDFLREIKDINSELVTNTVMQYVNQFLAISKDDWKNKDIAIYLFSSLATKGTVTNIGVTATNVLVDVVDFFSKNISQDLTEPNTHPILKVDSIKYIFIFRNQLTKAQLLQTFPTLIKHLDANANQVVYTYAAITIEKLLAMSNFSQDSAPVFTKTDIQPYVTELLTKLFNLLLLHNTVPEKLAENEFLIKCIMRVLSTSEDSLSERLPIIEQLINILTVTAKNPSNPRFSHYIFESLGLLIKYGLNDITRYIELVVPALLNILGEDVQEFVPYTFQILAFLLESYPKANGLPESYRSLIKPLLAPSVWEFRGSVPGIVRLLIAILEHDPTAFSPDISPLLGVFQKLISSKVQDVHGFDLLQSILLNVPLQTLTPFLNQIAILLLTRLKNSRTDKFVKKFILFISILTLQNSGGIDGDFVISLIESVQTGVFQQIYSSIILPTTSTLVNLQDKKIINVGISKLLLTQAFNGNYQQLSVPTIEQLAKNLGSYEGIASTTTVTSMSTVVSHAPLNELDLELSSFGSTFSRIVSIQNKPYDPVSNVSNNDFSAIKNLVLANIRHVNSNTLGHLSAEAKQNLHSLGI
jgi:exportin-2 (importin alpha re-exporter)